MNQVVGFNPSFNFGRMGWTCPGCNRCYSPDTSMCFYCPNKVTLTTTTTQPLDAPEPVKPFDPLPYIPQPGPTTPTFAPWQPNINPSQPPFITWTYPTSAAPSSLPTWGYMFDPATSGYNQVSPAPCFTGQCDPMHNYMCMACETRLDQSVMPDGDAGG